MANEVRLIDANEQIEKIKQANCVGCENYGGVRCRACWIDDAIGFMEDAPTVDAVPVVHGRWVGSGQWNHKPYRMRNKEKWQTYLCSECGHSNGRRFNDKYCPNCGADMRGDGNE